MESNLRRVFFFFYFEQLGLTAAKNPIRACAGILFQDRNITVDYYCVVVKEQMKVLLSASVSQPFYTEILISHFGRKICNVLKKHFNAVSLFLSSDGNTTP